MKTEIVNTLRPIKLAFFVQPGNVAEFNQAIEVCSFNWAGIYCPIIPLYKRLSLTYKKRYGGLHKGIAAYYSGLIENFDPDFIIISASVDLNTVQNYIKHRKIIPIAEILESQKKLEPKYAIGSHEIVNYLLREEFKFERADKRKLGVYTISEDSIFLSALFGSIPKGLTKKILGNFPRGLIENVKVTTANWLKSCNTYKKGWLSIGMTNTSASRHMIWSGETAVFIVNPESYLDILDYWNLRALGWRLLVIPINQNDSADFRRYVAEFFEQNSVFLEFFMSIPILNGINLNSNDYNNAVKLLDKIREDLKISRHFTHQHWYPRMWFEKEFLNYDKALCSSIFSANESIIVNFRNESLNIKVLKPKFNLFYSQEGTTRFKNEVRIDFEDFSGEFAEIIPAHIDPKEVGWLLGRMTMDRWRFSESGSFYLANEHDLDFTLNIPYSNDVFKAWAKTYNLKFLLTDNGRLAKNLLKKIEGVQGTRIFANRKFIEFLSLFEGGKSISDNLYFGKLNQFVKDYRNHDATSLSELLVRKQIVQLGSTIQCPLCQRRAFHSLSALDYKINCPNCLNKFDAPTHNPKAISWSYKGRGIFSQDNKANGLITQILLLRFFKFVLRGSLSSEFNFKLKGAKEYEIDVAFFYKEFKHSVRKSDFCLCECKTFKRFDRTDIARMEELGKKFPNSILIFATLNDTLDAKEIKLISTLANKFRKGFGSRPVNPVMVLTGNELLEHDIFQATKNLEPMIRKARLNEDSLHQYCDVTEQKYLSMDSWDVKLYKKIEKRVEPVNSSKKSKRK